MAITQVNGRLSSFRPPLVVITKGKRCIICPSHSTGMVRGWNLTGLYLLNLIPTINFFHYEKRQQPSLSLEHIPRGIKQGNCMDMF